MCKIYMDIFSISQKQEHVHFKKALVFFEIKFLKINCESGIVTAFFQIDFYVEPCTDFNIFCFENAGK